MTNTDCPYGFRVPGAVTEPRRLVDATAAFAGHCAIDDRSQPERECYLSAFQFGTDFRDHFRRHNSARGFVGPCWSAWLCLDIDRLDLEAAAADTRRLVWYILDRYRSLDDDDVLVQFTGKKGYLVSVPLTHHPLPSPTFNGVCRRLAEGLARAAGITIDPAIYVKLQPLRAPNSFHPRDHRYKRRVTIRELVELSTARITQLATEPLAFEPPVPRDREPTLEADWEKAVSTLGREEVERTARQRAQAPGSGRLQRDTLDFIAHGADEAERNNRLFRAAANLRELDAPPALVHALLWETALDCGLSPSEVSRGTQNGIEFVDRARGRLPEGGTT